MPIIQERKSGKANNIPRYSLSRVAYISTETEEANIYTAFAKQELEDESKIIGIIQKVVQTKKAAAAYISSANCALLIDAL